MSASPEYICKLSVSFVVRWDVEVAVVDMEGKELNWEKCRFDDVNRFSFFLSLDL